MNKKMLAWALTSAMAMSALGATVVSADSSAGEKVKLVLATNWGEGDSKYDYFYPKFQEFQESVKDTIDVELVLMLA